MSAHKSTRVSLVCKQCGTAFLMFPSDIVAPGRGQYCSINCRAVGRTIPVIDRFYRYVGKKQVNGCIPWSGATRDGYGVMIGAFRRNCNARAHRVAYELFVGPIPSGLHVLHRCDNRPCVNPTHLFVGEHLDNMRDKVSKNRQVRGERQHAAKLNEDKVRDIRRRCAAGEKQRDIAAIYGVTQPAIKCINRRQTWKHVTDD